MPFVRKYRRKPQPPIEAVQWLGPAGDAIERLKEWGARVEPARGFDSPHWEIRLETLSGPVPVFRGDWVCKSNAPGDYYPVKPERFLNLFELEPQNVEASG